MKHPQTYKARRVSWPVTLTSVPSSSSEPNASASPSAQSTSPAAHMASRDSNCPTSLGCSVNPSGGVLSTNPVGSTALIRVAEAALQVMGEAGEHQVPDVETALATGYGGNAWTEALIMKGTAP